MNAKVTNTPAGSGARARLSAWNLVVAGFAAATVGLLLDLPTIGSSGTSTAVSIVIAALIGIGILLAAGGMLQLRRAADRERIGARRGLAMQAIGLIGFLFGVVGLQVAPSIPVLILSAVFVLSAGALVVSGGVRLRNHHADIGAPAGTNLGYLVVGTALIFAGAGVILFSKIGYYFVLADVATTVVNDAGAAISACGCVIAAYSSFLIRGSIRRTPMPATGAPRQWQRGVPG